MNPTIVKKEDMIYNILPHNYEKILKIVKDGRYRDVNSFVDNALDKMIMWELNPAGLVSQLNPDELTNHQKEQMKILWKKDEYDKKFNLSESDEYAVINKLSTKNDDHLNLRSEFMKTTEYVKKLDFTEPKPEDIIAYDGNPILFSFYSRFLPAVISISVLANLLMKKNDWHIRLEELRPIAFDIANEIGTNLSVMESKDENFGRDNFLSTGLPKKQKENDTVIKFHGSMKRFCDQFVGKKRRDVKTKRLYLDGALSALGLINSVEIDGHMHVYLTKNGRELAQYENPVILSDMPKNSLSEQESNFIVKKLLPKLEIENQFIKSVLEHIRNSENPDGVTSDVLDDVFEDSYKSFANNNPDIIKKFNLPNLGNKDISKKHIVSWRVATMGRMSELNLVTWKISKNESFYSMNLRKN